jgi:hypothetical protein
MRREEREAIMRQGVVRPETPRERRELAGLQEDLRSVALRGKPLPLRLRNFRPAADGYLASLGGPLPYMVRLREIDALTGGLEADLSARWRAVAAESPGQDAFARAWRAEAAAVVFNEVNELIDRHNRWYPIEARLPMDPRRGDFALINGRDYRRRPLDVAWVLERFPPDLTAAAP